MPPHGLLHVVVVRVQPGTAPVRAGEGERAVGPQHTSELGQRSFRLGEMLEHGVREHDVDAVVLDGQFVGRARLEPRVGHAGQACGLPCHRHLRGLKVDAEYGDGGSLQRQTNRDRTRPAAHVEQPGRAGKEGKRERRPLPGGAPSHHVERIVLPARCVSFTSLHRDSPLAVTRIGPPWRRRRIAREMLATSAVAAPVTMEK